MKLTVDRKTNFKYVDFKGTRSESSGVSNECFFKSTFSCLLHKVFAGLDWNLSSSLWGAEMQMASTSDAVGLRGTQ